MRGAKFRASDRSSQDKVTECRQHGYLLSAKKIGTGAFSKVYLGYATQSKITQNYKLASDLRRKKHNMVAIKIISMTKAPPEYIKTFLYREIYTLNAAYHHPNVIQLYDSFCSASHVYLVLELASSGDLLGHINSMSQCKSTPGLSEDDARGIFKQIVNAVMHCHSNDIIHRDLKCENILLDAGGVVKLTDFGFANVWSDRKSLMSTFCGSVAYTAPEILLSCKYNGEQADLWSLGVILYAMVSGKLPYNEKHPQKLVRLIKKDLQFSNPISTACQDLIKGLLHWQPSARLPLSLVLTHHWMMPAVPGYLGQVRTTKSDITDQSKAKDSRTKEVASGARTRRACQSDTSTSARPPQAPPVRRAPASMPEGTKRNPVQRRSGTGHMACHGNACEEKTEDFMCIKPLSISPCRLLARPTQNETSDSNRLFFARPRPQAPPRPPSIPKPFRNLPNFRKPGSAPSPDPGTSRQFRGHTARTATSAKSRPRVAIRGL
ncbi:testis-specific serine/threonine-protein kinase 5-like [Chanos chanos]|uniref:non-specific serine/threonine protein kinase n=1 Tax=Chanos chanos TaxID=29144 RepID=A0A6J2WFL3_CHACN|nr:testis-specific serine/threonine-protein kinase 5-like [Chanos chanos]